MRRSFPIAVIVLAVVLLPAVPASAGGNWLDFRRDPSVGAGGGRNLGTWAVIAVGQRIVARAGIWTTSNPHRRERLSDSTYYAWLSSGEGFLEGTKLPADAIRLAPFRFHWTSNRTATARARFTVPSVPSGEYEVQVCDDPCTFSGFGDYVQGWITVRQTPEEARLFALARDRRWQVHQLSQKVGHLQGKAEGLEHELTVAERALGTHLRLQQAAGRAGAFDASGLGTSAVSTRPIVPGWAVLVLALAIVAAAVVIRRRGPSAFEIPDTVPDELVERAQERHVLAR